MSASKPEPISYQRRWQLKKLAEGKCITCGGKNDSGKTRCPKCYAKIQDYNRNYR